MRKTTARYSSVMRNFKSDLFSSVKDNIFSSCIKPQKLATHSFQSLNILYLGSHKNPKQKCIHF
jgi:hypothetical protein